MLYRYDNTQREHKFFLLKTESDYHIINPNGCIFYYQLPSNILNQTANWYNTKITIVLFISYYSLRPSETFIFIMSFHDISKKQKKPIFAVTIGIYVVQCSRLRQPNFFARLHMCAKYETVPICI